jgi:hypothetical protein
MGLTAQLCWHGCRTVSGSIAKVATALDSLVFTPMAHEVAPKATVTTTLTAAITDTGGDTTSTKSTVTATAVAVPITSATKAVATTAARVTLSAAANGTLSDPNATTDGSTLASGAD